MLYRKNGENYHLNKIKMCLYNDFHLYYIWQHDWKKNKEQCLYILTQLLTNNYKFANIPKQRYETISVQKNREYYIENVVW